MNQALKIPHLQHLVKMKIFLYTILFTFTSSPPRRAPPPLTARCQTPPHDSPPKTSPHYGPGSMG